MGILSAVGASLKNVLQEQWREVFFCDALDENTLLVRAQKQISARSGNTQQDDRIVSDGSVLFVADGQAVLVLSQGKVVDVCTAPGKHIFHDPTHPGGISGFFRDVSDRIAFGGDVQPRTHRVYYVNTKECPGNRFQTPAPIPLNLGDARLALDLDASVSCDGVYSFRITDPAVFYKAVSGNIEGAYTRNRLLSTLDSLLLTALQDELIAQVRGGIRPSALPECAVALAEAVRDRLTALTEPQYGIAIISLAFGSLQVSDAAMIAALQAHATLQDPEMRTAHLAGAAADAMQSAAETGA